MLVRTVDRQDRRAHLKKNIERTRCGKKADTTKSTKNLELCDECLEEARKEVTRAG